MSPPDDLLTEAKSVFTRAYAPYSKFKVGCALRGAKGNIFTGCNVENASYGLTICAERAAIFSAVSNGCLEFSEAVIVTDTPEPTPPCGACRQVLFEFSPNLKLWCANLKGTCVAFTLRDLLPHAFGPKSL